MLETMLQNVRERAPLVHNITNYVTVNDCANILLACGASPIMADDPDDAEEITAVCAALNLNIGTLNARTIPAMERAGRRANALGHPVLLDPVGAGASSLRTNTAARLLDELTIAAVRGNVSEIRALQLGARATRGVDAALEDRVTEENLPEAIAFAQAFSQRTGAVVAMTGAIDVVADAERAYVIRNGCAMMGRITGAGCMLSAMTAAYLAANPGELPGGLRRRGVRHGRVRRDRPGQDGCARRGQRDLPHPAHRRGLQPHPRRTSGACTL